MSRDSHRQFLEKAALNEAQKSFRQRGRSSARIEDFLALRVQTVEPWKRIVAIVVGAFFIGFAVWALRADFSPWAVVSFGLLGAICASVGIMGWKKPVEAVLEVTADVVFQRLIDVL